jgi:hypothetical protein
VKAAEGGSRSTKLATHVTHLQVGVGTARPTKTILQGRRSSAASETRAGTGVQKRPPARPPGDAAPYCYDCLSKPGADTRRQ